MSKIPSKSYILSELWDNSVSGLLLVSKSGQILKANPTICNITEYSEVELKNKKFQDITHPDDLNSDVELAKQVAEGDRMSYDMRKRYITKTGKVVWILLRVRPIKDKDVFVCFLSQILPMTPTVTTKVELPKKGTLIWITNNWPVIITMVSALALIIAELITNFKDIIW